jgi:hypothetical protein
MSGLAIGKNIWDDKQCIAEFRFIFRIHTENLQHELAMNSRILKVARWNIFNARQNHTALIRFYRADKYS